MLLTLSTAAPLMVSGGCWVWPLWKLTTISLVDVQQEIAVFAPCGQEFFPVVGLIALSYEPHQCCVVRKLHKVVGAVGWCAVVRQQGEEQRTEHAALWGPCAQGDTVGGVVANTHCFFFTI